jgi:hypothetical protein
MMMIWSHALWAYEFTSTQKFNDHNFCQTRLFLENPIALGCCEPTPTNAPIGGWGRLGDFGMNPY